MEQSQINGGAEECHSSESGWTMYIGSTTDDDEEDNDHNTQADPEDESDDSMASDASSGPSHYGNPWENIEGGYCLAEEEHDERFCLEKKENKTKGKQIAERKEEENETVIIDDKGKAQDQGDDKVRKNFRVEKRK